jgi:hypothetical protein
MNSRAGYTSGKLFEGSPFIFSKQKAKQINGGFKLFGAALTLYGVMDTESQYRNGNISLGRRKLNHLNNGAGVAYPPLAIPLAAGDYLGQRYSSQINRTVSQPGGHVYESMKWVLETLGIPTEKK